MTSPAPLHARLPSVAAGVRRAGGIVAGIAAMPGLHAALFSHAPVETLLWGLVAATVWGHAAAIAWVVDGFAADGERDRRPPRR